MVNRQLYWPSVWSLIVHRLSRSCSCFREKFRLQGYFNKKSGLKIYKQAQRVVQLFTSPLLPVHQTQNHIPRRNQSVSEKFLGFTCWGTRSKDRSHVFLRYKMYSCLLLPSFRHVFFLATKRWKVWRAHNFFSGYQVLLLCKEEWSGESVHRL